MKLLNVFPLKLLIPVLVLLGILFFCLILAYSNRVTYTTESFFESAKELSNPYQGFYHIIGYTLSDDYRPSGGSSYNTDAYTAALVLAEINLKNYRTCEISETGLLNADYDGRVMEKWRNTVWTGNDVFNGCDGLTYIKEHLGYRYFIRSCQIKKSGFIIPDLTLSLTVNAPLVCHKTAPLYCL